MIDAGGVGVESNRPATISAQSCGGHKEGVQVETPKGLLGQAALKGEGHGSGFGVFEEYQGALAPDGSPLRRNVMERTVREVREVREGRARPEAEMYFFPFSSLGGWENKEKGYSFPLLFFCLLFSFFCLGG